MNSVESCNAAIDEATLPINTTPPNGLDNSNGNHNELLIQYANTKHNYSMLEHNSPNIGVNSPVNTMHFNNNNGNYNSQLNHSVNISNELDKLKFNNDFLYQQPPKISMFNNFQDYMGFDYTRQSSMLSPPETPLSSGHQRVGLPFMDWVQPNGSTFNFDSNGKQNFNKQRAMSLPHIMPYHKPIFLQDRKFSVGNYHQIETPFICPEPNCGRKFQRIQNLKSHARCHLKSAPHNCVECGLGFKRTTDLQRHIKTIHTPNEMKPWGCMHCPKRFGRSDALKRHLTSKRKDHGCFNKNNSLPLEPLEEQ